MISFTEPIEQHHGGVTVMTTALLVPGLIAPAVHPVHDITSPNAPVELVAALRRAGVGETVMQALGVTSEAQMAYGKMNPGQRAFVLGLVRHYWQLFGTHTAACVVMLESLVRHSLVYATDPAFVLRESDSYTWIVQGEGATHTVRLADGQLACNCAMYRRMDGYSVLRQLWDEHPACTHVLAMDIQSAGVEATQQPAQGPAPRQLTRSSLPWWILLAVLVVAAIAAWPVHGAALGVLVTAVGLAWIRSAPYARIWRNRRFLTGLTALAAAMLLVGQLPLWLGLASAATIFGCAMYLWRLPAALKFRR